jgi:glutamate synthase (NADPH/NADH) large chain
LFAPSTPGPRRNTGEAQEHEIELALDTVLIEQAAQRSSAESRSRSRCPIRNVHRATCTLLSSHVARKHGSARASRRDDSAAFQGQRGAELRGVLGAGHRATLEGEANDGFGKGLSGGRLVVFPPEGRSLPEENVDRRQRGALRRDVGRGVRARGRGRALRRAQLGAVAVVEGCGDHGCEYMTGGRVVVLGPTGRNFAAGMSGGIAYVLDERRALSQRVNAAMVELDPLDAEDLLVRGLVHKALRSAR